MAALFGGHVHPRRGLCLGGVAALSGAMGAALAALFVGAAVSIGVLMGVRKKYNGGVF